MKTNVKLENNQINQIIDILKKDNIPHYELFFGKNKDFNKSDKFFYYEVNTRIYSIYNILRDKYNITAKLIYRKISQEIKNIWYDQYINETNEAI